MKKSMIQNSILVFRQMAVLFSLLGIVAQAQPAGIGQSGLIARSGDGLVNLLWDAPADRRPKGYTLFRSSYSTSNSFVEIARLKPSEKGFVDFQVTNAQTYFYKISTLDTTPGEAPHDYPAIPAKPEAFKDSTSFLEFLQQTAFDYFWRESNPNTGMIRDRSTENSPCSIAAIGFGLTAIHIGIEHGWISRHAGRLRVLRTLRTLWTAPQGPEPQGKSGHHGWFYHFVDLEKATRVWNCELSSIDTALLMAGILDARQFFNGGEDSETEIQSLANRLFDRVDWQWFQNSGVGISYGWKPESGFFSNRWTGYNEAMILYLLGLGAARDPLSPNVWAHWTSGYRWEKHYDYQFVPFPPLFGHQYTACWVDFRNTADDFMRSKQITYFENSRRATFANRAYCIANPLGYPGYGTNVWGLTASDGPQGRDFHGYAAHGAPPAELDDGTISPTAVGGSVPFAPEICIPTLQHFYSDYKRQLWGVYGFRDAFNLRANFFGPDVLGIDQGPIIIMIENHRTGSVWKRFMKAPEIQRGLKRAGFE